MPQVQTRTELIVTSGESPKRLDHFLANREPYLSRTVLQRLILGGHITVGGRAVRPSHKIKPGDCIVLTVPRPEPIEIKPEAISLDILYEDESILVLNKRAGLVVHPAPGHWSGTLVHALLYHLKERSGSLSSIGGKERPGLVHRLDKDTTGVMVVAKNDQAHEFLAHQFKDRQAEKRYLALVYGCVKEAEGIIDVSLGRDPFVRTKISTRSRRSRKALTRYQTIRNYRDFSYLRIYPHTGRTHQIRVHFQHLGHPVVGDETYGGKAIQRVQDPDLVESIQTLNRYFLHADSLAFVHPDTGERVSFEIPLPDALAELLGALK